MLNTWVADGKTWAKRSDLTLWAENPCSIDKVRFAELCDSITQLGQFKPLVVLRNGTVMGGNMRMRAFETLGIDDVYVSVIESENPKTAFEIALRDNERFGYYDELKLVEQTLKLDFTPLELKTFQLDLSRTKSLASLLSDGDEGDHAKMNDAFGVPPFSVLDTRQGYWQDQKHAWLDIGIQSEVGRDDGLMIKSTGFLGEKIAERGGGTSVFDPVLCELMYKWFNIPGGLVLDPFAGGSVRGVIAARLGYQYVGHELRLEQVEANRVQATDLCEEPMPVWIDGDSNATLDTSDVTADMVFSCPPYSDLEVYSDDPDDLSNMPYNKFQELYFSIIKKACAHLADNRFAVFVVGEVRNKKGVYYNFLGDTIKAFEAAGLQYYNELILVNPAGTLPLRAGRAFNASRKIGKMHQNVLVFYKGDLKAIKSNYPELKLPDPEETEESTDTPE